MASAWLDVDLDAVRNNTKAVAKLVSPAFLCAVVKADAYGHGATKVARAALDAGASWLAVAQVSEGLELRNAGVTAPILVLSEPEAVLFETAAQANLRVAVYSEFGVQAASLAAAATGLELRVHLKVDTGMRRVGAAPRDVVARAQQIGASPGVTLEGLWSHLAIADDPAHPFTARQLEVFKQAQSQLADAGFHPAVVHLANSAGALAHPETRFDMVRVGIALYGVCPADAVQVPFELEPAMSFRSVVAFVKTVEQNDTISYGLTHRFAEPTTVATIPVGYADGVARRFGSNGGEVLIRGQRCRVVGTVTMDQIMVNCGDLPVEVGDEVVLFGRQGNETISTNEWAGRLETIPYEVMCGIGVRPRRRWFEDGINQTPKEESI